MLEIMDRNNSRTGGNPATQSGFPPVRERRETLNSLILKSTTQLGVLPIGRRLKRLRFECDSQQNTPAVLPSVSQAPDDS